MGQPTSENPDPAMNVMRLMQQRAEEIARRWRERNPPAPNQPGFAPREFNQESVAPPRQPRPIRTSEEIIAEQARLEERLEAVRQQQARQDELTGSLNRELKAQEELNRMDIRLNPEVNRIAELFYSGIMRRVYFEFGHQNPDWASLGAREKKLWLEATEIVLDELSKTPVAHKELAAIVNKRIIQG